MIKKKTVIKYLEAVKEFCSSRDCDPKKCPYRWEIPHQKGEWIKHDTWDYSCSICGISTSVDDGIAEDLPNFCPNCGADMQKGGAE